MSKVETAIIGAGPYGLSLASHLRGAGMDFRIFGKPMESWSKGMPQGMFLKSDGQSSSLSAPRGALSIEEFHAEQHLPFRVDQPISLNTFVEYGRAFQAKMVPSVENEEVQTIAVSEDFGYELSLASGERVQANRVVLAIGVHPFRFVPAVLSGLGAEYCTHSSEYGPIENLIGKQVAVMGSGASSIDLAATLHESGIATTIVTRRKGIKFPGPPRYESQTLLRKLCIPDSGIGSGWVKKFYAEAPHIFHFLPRAFKAHIVRTALGPIPGWFMHNRIVGKVPILTGVTTRTAEIVGSKIHLTLDGEKGSIYHLNVDHIIAATGYRTKIERIELLSESIRRSLRSYQDAPILSANFESSCPGIYFIGPAAAMSFGPVMRFVFGCHFTAPRLARHLSRTSARHFAHDSSSEHSFTSQPVSRESS